MPKKKTSFQWKRPEPDANEVRALVQLVQQLADKHGIPGEGEAKHFVQYYLGVVTFFGTIPESSNFKDRYLMRAMLDDAQSDLVQEIVRLARHEFLCGPLIPWPVNPRGRELHMKAIENADFTQPTRLELAIVETVERLLAEMKAARIVLPDGSIGRLVRELPIHKRGTSLKVPNEATAQMLRDFVGSSSPSATQIMAALSDAYGRRAFLPLPRLEVVSN